VKAAADGLEAADPADRFAPALLWSLRRRLPGAVARRPGGTAAVCPAIRIVALAEREGDTRIPTRVVAVVLRWR
jgi:hypothetical protein